MKCFNKLKTTQYGEELNLYDSRWANVSLKLVLKKIKNKIVTLPESIAYGGKCYKTTNNEFT